MMAAPMNSIKFELCAPPFSVNSAYYLKSFSDKKATKIRTQACREWGDNILLQLQTYLDDILLFTQDFDEKKQGIEIKLIFYIPKAKFYTKAGTIHIQSNDLTNVEKLLVDILFDARFNDRTVGDTLVKNLNINDKGIVNLESKKRPSESQYKIEIEVNKISHSFPIAPF
jgi:hypothetical protein